MKIINIKLLDIVIIGMSISITFYLSKFTSLSPVYIIYIVLLFPIFIVFARNTKFVFSLDMFLILSLFIYIVLLETSRFGLKINGAIINLSLSLIAYLFIRSMRNKITVEKIIQIFNFSVWISIITITISSIYRISHPLAPLATLRYIDRNEDMFFYLYKYNSLLFADSNTSALILLTLFFSIISFEQILEFNSKNWKKAKIVIVLLLLSTISRSAILALLFGLVYLKFINFKSVMLKISAMILSVLLATYIFILIVNDPSFQTKMEIFHLVNQYTENLSLFKWLFGVGTGNAIVTLGVYTHILFLTYFVETGIIGLTLITCFIIYYMYKYSSILFVPVLVASMSYFLYLGAPFLFVPLAFIANIVDQKGLK